MFLRMRLPYLILLVITLLMAGAIGAVKYSDICSLRKVEVEPAQFSGDIKHARLPVGRSLFAEPFDKIATDLLRRDKILRVNLRYDLPHGINIKINEIEPLALVVGDSGRTIYRFDEHCYLFPADMTDEQFNMPVITGLTNNRPYMKVDDKRAYIVAEQLGRLKIDCLDFYMAISNIDMSNPEFITVYLDGISYPVDTYPGSLYKSIRSLETFLLDFNPVLNKVKRLDMRSEGLIIAVGEKCPKKESLPE